MTDNPTPQDFIEAANALQDVASRDKIELPPCTSFCQNSDNSNGICRACFEREKTSHGILLNIAKRMTADSHIDYPQWLFSLIEEAIQSDKPQANIKTQGMDMIPKLSNYVVAKGLTTAELSVAVNKRLDDGWITLGGVSSAVETIPVEAEKGLFPKRPESKTKEVTIFIQAMGMPSKNI